MNVQLLTRKIIRKFRDDGVLTTCWKALSNFTTASEANDFDSRYGTDTGGLEPLWKLSIGSPNAQYGERYEATTESELTASLNYLDEDLRNFTFVDLGCGKGRTLIVASRLGFECVIGVEFARELADIAQRNIQRVQARNATVLHADAADFAFPDRDLVLYLYNPFSEPVLCKVLTNLQASTSKKLYVIYKGPRCAQLLDADGAFERLGCPPSAPHMQVWAGRCKTRLQGEVTE